MFLSDKQFGTDVSLFLCSMLFFHTVFSVNGQNQKKQQQRVDISLNCLLFWKGFILIFANAASKRNNLLMPVWSDSHQLHLIASQKTLKKMGKRNCFAEMKLKGDILRISFRFISIQQLKHLQDERLTDCSHSYTFIFLFQRSWFQILSGVKVNLLLLNPFVKWHSVGFKNRICTDKSTPFNSHLL